MTDCRKSDHAHGHAFTHFNALDREGLTLLSRRNMLKAGLAGIAGLTVPDLLRLRAKAAQEGQSIGHKSVILLWMAGGPSHIDTWDPKPDRPFMNRGPFSPISTKVPGAIICEHLPKQAAMLDKFTIIRSVDVPHFSKPYIIYVTYCSYDGNGYTVFASVMVTYAVMW